MTTLALVALVLCTFGGVGYAFGLMVGAADEAREQTIASPTGEEWRNYL